MYFDNLIIPNVLISFGSVVAGYSLVGSITETIFIYVNYG